MASSAKRNAPTGCFISGPDSSLIKPEDILGIRVEMNASSWVSLLVIFSIPAGLVVDESGLRMEIAKKCPLLG